MLLLKDGVQDFQIGIKAWTASCLALWFGKNFRQQKEI